MSIFGKIMSAIFGTKAEAAPASGGAAAGTATGAGPAAGSSAPAQTVEVAPILDKAVAAKKEKLEWRTSIVDLMKALDIDSSPGARKELAKELGFSGDSNDSFVHMTPWIRCDGRSPCRRFALPGQDFLLNPLSVSCNRVISIFTRWRITAAADCRAWAC